MKANYSQNNYNGDFSQHILEQYKLYVEMADKVSERRMSTNNFFVSLETLLVGALAFYDGGKFITTITIAVVGILLSISWFYILNSYRQLNSGKFLVVHELEKLLPTSPYDEEWQLLGSGDNIRKYWPLSHLERILPILFGILYSIALLEAILES